jgi:hypothetical protein
MIYKHRLCIHHLDSQSLAQHIPPWDTTTWVVVNHCELSWDSGCESWCAMISKCVGIMVCYSEPMVVNNDVLSWTSGCESCCCILSQCSPWFKPTRSAYLTIIHTHWLRISHQDSEPLAQQNTPWFTNKVCYYEPVNVNRGVLCWASDCESCFAMLSHWLWIIVCYAESVGENHGVLLRASVCDALCDMLSQWFWTAYHNMIHSLWHSITYHDSQTLANHTSLWFTTTDSA